MTTSLKTPAQATPAPTAGPVAVLRKLAANSRLASRARQLTALADALDSRVDADRWAGVDLFAAFPPSETVTRGRAAWVARCADMLIQILFFAPIFITWLGLLHATIAYRQLVRIKRYANESFLYGWQNGFNGRLPKEYYLDRIAVYVVLIIATLVIAMVAQSFYRGWLDEEVPGRLRRELIAALTAADLELASYRLSSPGQVAAELKKAAVEFDRTATAIRAVGETARQTQAAAKSSVISAGTALAKVDALAKAATSAAGEVSKAASELDHHLTDMSAKTSELVRAQNDFAQKVGNSSNQLAGSMTGVGTQLKNSLEASQRRIEAAVDGSSAKIADALTAGTGQVGQALAQVATIGTGYAHRVETAADLIGQAGNSVQEMAGLIAGFRTSVADLSGKIGALESVIAKANTAAPGTDAVGSDLRSALSDVKAAAAAFRAAAAALQSEARTLQRPPAARQVPAEPPQPSGNPATYDAPTATMAPGRAEPEAESHDPGPGLADRPTWWRRWRSTRSTSEKSR